MINIKNKIINILNKIPVLYLYLIIIILLLLSILISFLYINKKTIVVKKEIKYENKVEEKDNSNKIKIDLKGAVNSPGVYELEEGMRVIDAINMAGGLLDTADTTILNLSKKLIDEMTIIIYTKEEIKNYQDKNKTTEYVYVEVDSCPDKINQACITPYKSETNKSDTSVDDKAELISINTATLEELQTLNGIGESKAKAIIQYREENGNFSTIEDIKKVSGIGDSAFEKIKDNITI